MPVNLIFLIYAFSFMNNRQGFRIFTFDFLRYNLFHRKNISLKT